MHQFGTHIKIDRFHRSYLKFGSATQEERIFVEANCGWPQVNWKTFGSEEQIGDGYNIYLKGQLGGGGSFELEKELRFVDEDGEIVLKAEDTEAIKLLYAVRTVDRTGRKFGEEGLEHWYYTFNGGTQGGGIVYTIRINAVVGGTEVGAISYDFEDTGEDCALPDEPYDKCIIDYNRTGRDVGSVSSSSAGITKTIQVRSCGFNHNDFLGGTNLGVFLSGDFSKRKNTFASSTAANIIIIEAAYADANGNNIVSVGEIVRREQVPLWPGECEVYGAGSVGGGASIAGVYSEDPAKTLWSVTLKVHGPWSSACGSYQVIGDWALF